MLRQYSYLTQHLHLCNDLSLYVCVVCIDECERECVVCECENMRVDWRGVMCPLFLSTITLKQALSPSFSGRLETSKPQLLLSLSPGRLGVMSIHEHLVCYVGAEM